MKRGITVLMETTKENLYSDMFREYKNHVMGVLIDITNNIRDERFDYIKQEHLFPELDNKENHLDLIDFGWGEDCKNMGEALEVLQNLDKLRRES